MECIFLSFLEILNVHRTCSNSFQVAAFVQIAASFVHLTWVWYNQTRNGSYDFNAYLIIWLKSDSCLKISWVRICFVWDWVRQNARERSEEWSMYTQWDRWRRDQQQYYWLSEMKNKREQHIRGLDHSDLRTRVPEEHSPGECRWEKDEDRKRRDYLCLRKP